MRRRPPTADPAGAKLRNRHPPAISGSSHLSQKWDCASSHRPHDALEPRSHGRIAARVARLIPGIRLPRTGRHRRELEHAAARRLAARDRIGAPRCPCRRRGRGNVGARAADRRGLLGGRRAGRAGCRRVEAHRPDRIPPYPVVRVAAADGPCDALRGGVALGERRADAACGPLAGRCSLDRAEPRPPRNDALHDAVDAILPRSGMGM